MLNALIRFSLSQRLVILLAALTLFGGGFWAYRNLPIDAFPDISTTQVQVIVKAPGMAPEEVEQRVTYPIETQVRGIPNQTILRSTTKFALAVVTIDFRDGTDIYWARQQVSERIGTVLAGLPEGVEGDLAPITMPLSDVYMFLVEGDDYTTMERRTILDWMIRPELLSVEGVADVNSLGGEVQSFRIEPRPNALQAYGLTVTDIIEAVARNNRNAGGGQFTHQDAVYLIRTDGRIGGMDEIAGISVTSRDSVPIHIGDVAEVTQAALTRYGGVVANGKGEAVQGLVLNRRGANGRKTVEGVKEALEQLEPSLPEGIRIVPFYDRSDLINRAVSTVEKALREAVVLVLIVLALFLWNWRSALTAGLILPLTVITAFLPMYYFGLSANLMSLGGLAIAIGILVDSAVVMVENIHSQLRQADPKDRMRIIARAAQEVAQPIFSGALIIVASFIPILSLTGVEGKLFGPLALTIVFALLTALFLSLTVIPVLSGLFMRAHGSSGSAESDNFVQRILLRIYRPSLDFALNHRRFVTGAGLVLLVAAGGIFPFIGKEFLPYLDEGTMIVQFEKPPSINLEDSLALELRLQEALIEKVPDLTGMVSRVGSDELRLDPMGLNESDAFLVTRPRSQWEAGGTEAFQAQVREVLKDFPGINYGFTQPIDMRVSEMLTGVRAAVALKLQGDELEVLDRKAREIEEVIASIPGSVDIFRMPLEGQGYLTIRMRDDIMSTLGLTVDDVNGLIENAVGGVIATEVIQGNRRIPVMVRYPDELRNRVDLLEDLTLRTAAGERIRLGDVALLELQDGPVQIQRENGRRQVVLQTNVQGRDVVGFVEELRERVEQEVDLPAGYTIRFGGQFENQQRAAARLGMAVPAALGLIFLILFFTFRRIRQVLLILFNVPLALIGGIFLLALTGLYLSVPASVGFIALLGIAVMNGVVMVNHFNELRERGLELRQAATEGARNRLRPVLMTAILTVLGLVPLLLATGPGSEIQKPLAIVVVGGVFTSTALTLILLPVFYVWIEGGYRDRVDEPAEEAES
jgi:cobalt-zinc-cadmium resistance protein CzcA